MPDLNSAAAGWVQARMLPAAAEAAPQQAGPSNAAAAAAAAAVPPAPTVAPERLPLSHMRMAGGKLFTDNQDLVPAVDRPAELLRWPLKLGSVVLPLATVNEEKLKEAAVSRDRAGAVGSACSSCAG